MMLRLLLSVCIFFLFKQKTAYELRISDWSSDVCSSDLLDVDGSRDHARDRHPLPALAAACDHDDHRFHSDRHSAWRDLGGQARHLDRLRRAYIQHCRYLHAVLLARYPDHSRPAHHDPSLVRRALDAADPVCRTLE